MRPGNRPCKSSSLIVLLNRVQQIRWSCLRCATDLAVRVISIAGLHDQVFLLRCYEDIVISLPGFRAGTVAKAILAAEFLFNLGVYIADRLLLGNLKKTPTSLLRD